MDIHASDFLTIALLVLLEGLLLVFCDKVVKVGSALAGRDVPWRSGVEDPVNIKLARVLLTLLRFRACCLRVYLLSQMLYHLPPLHSLFLARGVVETYSGNLMST